MALRSPAGVGGFEARETAAVGGGHENRAAGIRAAHQRDGLCNQLVPAFNSQVRAAGLVEQAEHHLGGGVL